jgi:uridine kinase
LFTIGIAGGTGSGKSTFVEKLFTPDLANRMVCLPHDAYYLNRTDMPIGVRDSNNWDHPDALDTKYFLEHVAALQRGEAIERPEYDFALHSRKSQTHRVEPRPILLLEGILLLAIPEVRQRIDLKIFIDTPPDLRILRRVLRDVNERGRSVESIIEQYLSTVRPMHSEYVEPSRRFADLIVPWEWHNAPAVELIKQRVLLATMAR